MTRANHDRTGYHRHRARERSRLGNFIRRRVADQTDADDILQDVFYEFVQAYRLPEPIEQVSAWLFRVARNRIIDRFRKKKEVALEDLPRSDEDDEYHLDLMLPSPDAGPEAAYTRHAAGRTAGALEDLPANQREVFVAHELDGVSFKEMAEQTGVSINTLLAASATPCCTCASACKPCMTNETNTKMNIMKWKLKFILILAAIAAMSGVVMWLWNWLIPESFPAPNAVNYWQALGLLLLCRILFGGFRGHHRDWHDGSASTGSAGKP
jgi:RNA polymerase sigma factor (sigma-70 family)